MRGNEPSQGKVVNRPGTDEHVKRYDDDDDDDDDDGMLVLKRLTQVSAQQAGQPQGCTWNRIFCEGLLGCIDTLARVVSSGVVVVNKCYEVVLVVRWVVIMRVRDGMRCCMLRAAAVSGLAESIKIFWKQT